MFNSIMACISIYIMATLAVLGTLAIYILISDCKRQKKIDEELTKNKF